MTSRVFPARVPKRAPFPSLSYQCVVSSFLALRCLQYDEHDDKAELGVAAGCKKWMSDTASVMGRIDTEKRTTRAAQKELRCGTCCRKGKETRTGSWSARAVSERATKSTDGVDLYPDVSGSPRCDETGTEYLQA